jgi:putative AlgH/UPF0301 family transcriptional regulator
VEPTRAWILTANRDLDADALEVTAGVYLSASSSLVRKTLECAPDPNVRMVVGYAAGVPASWTSSLPNRRGWWHRSSPI